MKKLGILFFGLLFSIVGTGRLYAGSIDYLINQSAEYFRIMSRNAATDSADIVNYNPAGTVRMENGTYINFSSQYLAKDYEFKMKGGDTYSQSEPTPFLPNLYALYKKDQLAFFWAFTIPAGGGSVIFNDGVPYIQDYAAGLGATLLDQKFEGSSVYQAHTLGGAFEINDALSVSLGVRQIQAKKTYKGNFTASLGVTLQADLDVEEKAAGMGQILGVDFVLNENLNLGFRYETQTDLKWKTKVKKQTNVSLFTDGEKSHSNLPALLGLGAEYRVNKELYATFSVNRYLITDADSGKDSVDDPFSEDYDDHYTNGWDIGFGAGYQLNPSLELSAGYLRTIIGGNHKTYSDFETALDARTLGFGGKYNATSNLDVNFALAYTLYDEGKAILENGSKETFNKNVTSIGAGVEYMF